jgi:arylsulfatase A-like enzyme
LFLTSLLVIYASVGVLLGGVWGCILAVLRRPSGLSDELSVGQERFLEAGALIGVLGIFALNISFRYDLERSSLIVLAMCLALCLAAVIRSGSHQWSVWLESAANPASALVIGVGTAWLLLEVLRSHDSRPLKGAVVLGFPLAVYGVSGGIRAIRRRWLGSYVPGAFHRMGLVGLVAIASALAVCSAYGPRRPLDQGIGGTVSAESPNVVLIILDTVRADHMSIYGYGTATTPGLAEFARVATLYSQAIAASDMTLASHGSIFTGLYARSHGARYDLPASPIGAPLSDEFYTLAEFLSDLGYATVGVVANHAYVGRGMNLNQGFQYYDDRRGRPLLVPAQDLFVRQLIFELLRSLMPSSASDKSFRTAEEINEEVFGLLDDVAATESPFFLFVNYMDAHWPYAPPSPYDSLVPGRNESLRTDEYSALLRDVLKGQRRVTETLQQRLVADYDGALAYLDDQVMRLIEELKALDLYRNTLIIITSDHGEAFGRRNLIGHGVSLYQDQVHVPLLMKWPDSESGGSVHELVSHVDLFPTVVDLVDREAPRPFAGVSLLKLTSDTARHVISESYPNGTHAYWHERHDRLERSLFAGGFKLVTSSRGKRELYALEQDPDEYHNLFDEEPEQAAVLQGLLDDWMAANDEFLNDELGSDEQLEIDEETLDRLRALGYIR